MAARAVCAILLFSVAAARVVDNVVKPEERIVLPDDVRKEPLHSLNREEIIREKRQAGQQWQSGQGGQVWQARPGAAAAAGRRPPPMQAGPQRGDNSYGSPDSFTQGGQFGQPSGPNQPPGPGGMPGGQDVLNSENGFGLGAGQGAPGGSAGSEDPMGGPPPPPPPPNANLFTGADSQSGANINGGGPQGTNANAGFGTNTGVGLNTVTVVNVGTNNIPNIPNGPPSNGPFDLNINPSVIIDEKKLFKPDPPKYPTFHTAVDAVAHSGKYHPHGLDAHKAIANVHVAAHHGDHQEEDCDYDPHGYEYSPYHDWHRDHYDPYYHHYE